MKESDRGSIMTEPDLESFRRWLQAEIRETEELPDDPDRRQRLLHLETALQEALAFEAAWSMRVEAEVEPVERTRAVRLVSAAPAAEVSVSTGTCRHCEAPMDPGLEFCGACGGYP